MSQKICTEMADERKCPALAECKAGPSSLSTVILLRHIFLSVSLVNMKEVTGAMHKPHQTVLVYAVFIQSQGVRADAIACDCAWEHCLCSILR